jgi:hypothetical protein
MCNPNPNPLRVCLDVFGFCIHNKTEDYLLVGYHEIIAQAYNEIIAQAWVGCM